MPALENDRHERFVHAYLRLGSATQAYMEVYATPKTNSTMKSASRLKALPHVSERIDEIQREAAERARHVVAVTIVTVTEELEAARKAAMEEGQIGAAVSASMGKAKLHGLIIEKRVNAHFDMVESPGDLTDAEIDRELLRRRSDIYKIASRNGAVAAE